MVIDYIHLDSVDSTNNWVKKHVAELTSFTCVTAREQTAGRGRFERHWVSPRDQNIYATLYFTLATYLPNIGQLMAFSCVKMLRSHGLNAFVKWPNDILIDSKKAGGVLTETFSQQQQIDVIVGIGLNVNMEEIALQTIDQVATSMAVSSGKKWDLKLILHELMGQFLEDLSLLKEQGFKPFRLAFENCLAYKGQRIACLDGKRKVEGICQGMTDDGKLILILPTKDKVEISAGEVTTTS
jgi:BirA family biotin operon repressor/biotin-[acetyl-CoA-carboxylase] ligase